MLGSATGPRIGITGLGTHVPERVLTNDELAAIVDTTDEWIQERTGIRERRIAAAEEPLTDIALPAARGGCSLSAGTCSPRISTGAIALRSSSCGTGRARS